MSAVPAEGAKAVATTRGEVLATSAGCHASDESLRACGRQCFANPHRPQCASDCLVGAGLQESCATCYSQKIDCTLNNCLLHCALSATGQSCLSCVAQHCTNCESSAARGQVREDAQGFAVAVMSAVPAEGAKAVATTRGEVLATSAGCHASDESLRACGRQCFANPHRPQCASDCLVGAGLQESCATCYSQRIDCTLNNCLSHCALSATGQACLSCVAQHCTNCESGAARSQGQEDARGFAVAVMSPVPAEASRAAATPVPDAASEGAVLLP